MGGYGALVHGLSHPDRFAAIGSFSGAVQPKILFGKDSPAPLALAKKCADENIKIPLYISCGDKDFLYDENITFKAELEKLGFDVTFETGEGYIHEWRFWNREVERFMDWIPRTDRYYNNGSLRKI